MEAKPRVLVLSPSMPTPLNAGMRRVLTACRHLKDRYDLVLLTFDNPPEVYAHADREDGPPAFKVALELWQDHQVRDAFCAVHKVPLPKVRSWSEARYVDGVLLPEDAGYRHTPEMEEALRRVIAQEGIEMVHVEFDLMAPYVETVRRSFPGMPCVLTHHDLGAIALFHSYFREMSDWRRFLRLRHWWRRIAFTQRMCRKFDSVIVLTEADRTRLARMIGLERISVIPTGVDLDQFGGGLPREERDPDTMIYVGHYLHYPNEDAVLRFAREILPLIWKRRPQAKFQIVGSDPTAKIRQLAADPRIAVTGTVMDVRDFEARAAVMVAPLRLGRGIKGKILEAFATGTPVVATSLANEGIRARPGRDILTGDSPARFADQVLRVLSEPALWESLSRNGKDLVEKDHSWSHRSEQLDGLYRSVLNKGRTLHAAPAA